MDVPLDSSPVTTGSRARWAVGLLVASLVLSVVAVLSDAAQITLLQRVQDGTFSQVEALANDSRQAFIGGVQLLLLIATGIAFLRWVHRTYQNLSALGVGDLRFSPGWAVGWFLVPIMNLFRPYQVMREIWTASNPALRATDAQTRERALISPVLGLWWALWITSNLVGSVIFLPFSTGTSIDDLITGSWVLVVSEIMTVGAAALAIVVVRTIDAYQRQDAIVPDASGENASGKAAR